MSTLRAPDAEIAGKVLAMLGEMETTAESNGFPEPAIFEGNCPRSALASSRISFGSI